jgi:hypothetical protein
MYARLVIIYFYDVLKPPVVCVFCYTLYSQGISLLWQSYLFCQNQSLCTVYHFCYESDDMRSSMKSMPFRVF